MREVRLALLAEIDTARSILESWQEAVNKRGKLDLLSCHKQTIKNKYLVMRWDWMPLSKTDLFDLINICESSEAGFQFIVINRNLSGVENYTCHPRFQLPIRLEPRITVDVIDDKPKKDAGARSDAR